LKLSSPFLTELQSNPVTPVWGTLGITQSRFVRVEQRARFVSRSSNRFSQLRRMNGKNPIQLSNCSLHFTAFKLLGIQNPLGLVGEAH